MSRATFHNCKPMGKTKETAAALRMARPAFKPESLRMAYSPGSAKLIFREMREAAYREQVGASADEIDFFTNATHTQNVTHKRSHA